MARSCPIRSVVPNDGTTRRVRSQSNRQSETKSDLFRVRKREITLTDIDYSAATAISKCAEAAPQSTALIYHDRETTYSELTATVASLAAVLADNGVREGDRVAYTGFNSPTFLTTYLASSALGAVFVPVNFRLTEPEVQAILVDAGARVLISEPTHIGVVDAIAERTFVTRFLLVDDDPAVPAPDTTDSRWASLSAALAAPHDPHPPIPRKADDLAVLIYTSGTTGRPKGVMLTHGNIWWNGTNVDRVVDTRRTDVNLAVAPLFHIGGLNAFTIRNLVRGGTTVLHRSFDPAAVLADLVRYRVNQFFAVPAMFAALERTPGFSDADLSDLRAAVVAGAPVPPVLISNYARRGIDLQQAWGLTETAPFATYLPGELTNDKLGSAGIAMPHTEIRLVDPVSGVEVDEAGIRAEVWVKGPNVAAGYWRNPTATAEAFVTGSWFRSGDIGYRDDDGYLYIADRLKDMIISGGENVYPAEVEAVLTRHPKIVEVAVVGSSDERWGESVVAVVVAEDGTELTIDDVQSFAQSDLARYKLPRRMIQVDTMPRNASGKLDKGRVRKIVHDLVEPSTRN